MKTDQPILAYMLFTMFVGMKLTGHIEWSWLWVFAPLWVYLLGTIVGAFILAMFKVALLRTKKTDTKITGKGG